MTRSFIESRSFIKATFNYLNFKHVNQANFLRRCLASKFNQGFKLFHLFRIVCGWSIFCIDNIDSYSTTKAEAIIHMIYPSSAKQDDVSIKYKLLEHFLFNIRLLKEEHVGIYL